MHLGQEFIKEYQNNGFVVYPEKIFDTQQIEEIIRRGEEAAQGRSGRVPAHRTNFEPIEKHKPRKTTGLCYYDPFFKNISLMPEVLDVVEQLMGPNIKVYTDEFFWKLPSEVQEKHKGYRWHQDAVYWDMFTPQDHITCWIALDDATLENGCLQFIPGSHKAGAVPMHQWDRFVDLPEYRDSAVPIELEAGQALFHHGLNFHMSEANTSDKPRRSLGLHYIKSETHFLGVEDESLQRFVECDRDPGQFRFMLARGKEFAGRV